MGGGIQIERERARLGQGMGQRFTVYVCMRERERERKKERKRERERGREREGGCIPWPVAHRTTASRPDRIADTTSVCPCFSVVYPKYLSATLAISAWEDIVSVSVFRYCILWFRV